MVSGTPVGITQKERFFSYDTVLLGVRYVLIARNCLLPSPKKNSGLP
jgi:hypothetical protein